MGQPSGAEEQEMPSPDACDSGGESTAAGGDLKTVAVIRFGFT